MESCVKCSFEWIGLNGTSCMDDCGVYKAYLGKAEIIGILSPEVHPSSSETIKVSPH